MHGSFLNGTFFGAVLVGEKVGQAAPVLFLFPNFFALLRLFCDYSFFIGTLRHEKMPMFGHDWKTVTNTSSSTWAILI